jgi:hypothetical protein
MSNEELEFGLAAKVATLADLEAAMDLIKSEQHELIQSRIPQEVKLEIEEIKAEYADRLATFQESYEHLKREVTAEVLALGETVRCGRKQAVYISGRVSWDSKKLERLAKQYPEILEARKQGEAYITLRNVDE